MILVVPKQVLQSILANWDAFKNGYYQQFGKELAFKDQREAIHQMYSLLTAVVKVIKACQAHDHPSAVSGYYSLIRLRTVELDMTKPLRIIDPVTEEQVTEVVIDE
jgi:hypothetical protein